MTSPRIVNSAIVLGSIVFSLLLSELVLRLIYHPTLHISGWRSNARHANQLGYRGQRIEYKDDDFVVVLLGDSQVTASYFEFERMPERRLQHYLGLVRKNLKVFSIGCDGYGQDQELLALQEYFRSYRADLVVLWQTRKNDIWNNIFPTHHPHERGAPKPTFWLDGDRLSGPSEQLGEKINASSFRIVTLINEYFWPVSGRDLRWESRLPPPYVPLSQFTGEANQTWQILFDRKKNYLYGDNIETEKTHLAPWLTPPSDRMLYGREITRKLLRVIENSVEEQGGTFALFEAVRPKVFADEKEETYVLNGKYYRASEAQAESSMKYIREGFTAYQIPITIDNWEQTPGRDHLNEVGIDQVLRDLSDALLPHIVEGTT